MLLQKFLHGLTQRFDRSFVCLIDWLISPGSGAVVTSTGFGRFTEGEPPFPTEKVFSLTRGGVVFRGPSSFPFAFGFWCEQSRILCWNIYLYGLWVGIIFSRTIMMPYVVHLDSVCSDYYLRSVCLLPGSVTEYKFLDSLASPEFAAPTFLNIHFSIHLADDL